MKVTVKGQVTIPQHIRRHLGVEPHAEVDFRIQDGVVVLFRIDRSEARDAGSRFEAYRGSNKDGLTTEDWMTATRGE